MFIYNLKNVKQVLRRPMTLLVSSYCLTIYSSQGVYTHSTHLVCMPTPVGGGGLSFAGGPAKAIRGDFKDCRVLRVESSFAGGV